MSSPQIKYDTSTSSPDRLVEVVAEELVGAESGQSPIPAPYDELTIALIGPSEALRNEMARALIGSGA